MNEPKLDEYMLPVLKVFVDKKEHKYHKIIEILTAKYDLVQRDKPKRSMIMINNSLGSFVKAKVLEKTEEKTFKILDRGIQLIEESPEKLSIKDLRQFKEFDEYIMSRYKKNKPTSIDIGTELPEDRIESAYEIYKSTLADDLLEKIKDCSWQFFEILVKDLLVAMGYGDPYDEARISKGAGDEGIDGVIKEDRLGLDSICLQAKKWENTVGRPEIQKFAGSIESKRARKGVFITTSNFSQEAYEYVNHIEKKIILIDGQKLAELMIDYNVGLSCSRTYILKKIDSDYFDS
jgi:restriction system protein